MPGYWQEVVGWRLTAPVGHVAVAVADDGGVRGGLGDSVEPVTDNLARQVRLWPAWMRHCV